MSLDVEATDPRSERLLIAVAELERRDEAIAAEIAEIAELAERAGALRARGAEIAAQLDALPAELEIVATATRAAHEGEQTARVELQEAEDQLAALEGARRRREEDIARARRTAQDAREALDDAEARIVRLEARRAEVHELERALVAETDELVVTARDVAAAIGAVPRVSDAGKTVPGATLGELEEWGARARAALFVARGTLDTERERIVAEAEALGAAVLGEDLAGASVLLVRRRLEQALS